MVVPESQVVLVTIRVTVAVDAALTEEVRTVLVPRSEYGHSVNRVVTSSVQVTATGESVGAA